MHCRIFFLFCALILSRCLTAAETRLAILALGKETRSAADLLTVGLSRSPGIALLERDEIERVFHEQSAVPGQKTDFARLGKLLKADGLVLIQLLQSGTNGTLAVRLVAVNSGVVLDSALYPFPVRESEEWTSSSCARLALLFPKLAVTRDRAVPISQLNLRAAVGTAASAQTE